MFTSLREPPPLPGSDAGSEAVVVTVNNKKITAHSGQTVWATMAQAGQLETRRAAVSGTSRSAYCAMGVCFECLVEIDGMPNQQACLRRVQDGMTITTQTITENSKADPDEL